MKQPLNVNLSLLNFFFYTRICQKKQHRVIWPWVTTEKFSHFIYATPYFADGYLYYLGAPVELVKTVDTARDIGDLSPFVYSSPAAPPSAHVRMENAMFFLCRHIQVRRGVVFICLSSFAWMFCFLTHRKWKRERDVMSECLRNRGIRNHSSERYLPLMCRFNSFQYFGFVLHNVILPKPSKVRLTSLCLVPHSINQPSQPHQTSHSTTHKWTCGLAAATCLQTCITVIARFCFAYIVCLPSVMCRGVPVRISVHILLKTREI